MARKRQSVGQTIGGIVAGIEQQIFRTTPPAQRAGRPRARRLRRSRPRVAARSASGCRATRSTPRPRRTTRRRPRPAAPPVGAGRRGRRRPGRRRADRLVRGRWPRAALTDGRRRRSRLGLVPDGAVRRAGPRRPVRVRRASLRPPDRAAAARHPRHGPRSTLAGGRRPNDHDRARAGLAVRRGVVQRFELDGRAA